MTVVCIQEEHHLLLYDMLGLDLNSCCEIALQARRTADRSLVISRLFYSIRCMYHISVMLVDENLVHL